MGKNTFQIIENNKVLAETSIFIYDFYPVVKINNDKKDISNTIWYNENCNIEGKEKIKLDEGIKKELREYVVPEIIINKNIENIIPLKIIKGINNSKNYDENGIIEIDCSNSNVSIKIEEHIKNRPNEKAVKFGDEIILKIKSEAFERSNIFDIIITAKDNLDDTNSQNKISDKIIIVGKLKVKVIEKDVFDKEEISRLNTEVTNCQNFDSSDTPGNGYCIITADRSLGALLNQKKSFYQEKKGGRIRLERASSRLKQIKKMGFIYSKGNIANHIKEFVSKNKINLYPNYEKGIHCLTTNNYNSSNKPTKLNVNVKELLEKEINGKSGFHVYYLSMHGQYHVMLLVIDNTNPCDIKFNILDQGYISETDIDFNNIDNKFLNLMQNFWESKNNNAKYILLWKISRK